MSSDDSTKKSSIRVSVRVRPFTEDESKHLSEILDTPFFASDGQLLQPAVTEATQTLKSQQNSIRKIVNVVDERMLIFDPPSTNPLISMQRKLFPTAKLRTKIRDCRFVFDRLFDEDSTQQEVYENTTKPLLDSILDGYNATVFAYGATGCGKTYTILGTPLDPGVIFLTLKELYEKIDQLSNDRVFDLSVLFLEIYNETIRDLLSPLTPSKQLNLREDVNNRITVSNLLSHKPLDMEDIQQLIIEGNRNRTSSPTQANAASSRSHAVLQINVTLRLRTASLTEEHLFATLLIIDLAGSERAANTKNRGATLHEGANINKSLLALGNCINALCDPRRRNHVPYRDLKLTRLLKFSLGGNCKTVMIVCISPLSKHYDETFNTLKYADRVKEIKTKVIRNRQNLDRHVGSYLKMITEQKQEIEEIRAREAKVLESERKVIRAQNESCLEALMQHFSSLQGILDRQVSEKWKNYYLLAKRKLLLLNVNNLEVIYAAMKKQSEQVLHEKVDPAVERCFMQVELLRSKFNEQITHLEKLYESSSEIKDALARSKDHANKKLQEMKGWTELHSKMHDIMFEAIEDQLHNDLLLNSSILFEFLVTRLNEFNYLLHALCDFTQIASSSNFQKYLSEAFDNVTKVLELMNNSEYDILVEELTSSYMSSKLKLGNVKQSSELSQKMPRLSSPKASISMEKRANTSPLRNSPASKRLILSPILNGQESNGCLEIDTSADLSCINKDEDSPLSDRINNSMIVPEDLSFKQLTNSPPMNKLVKDLKLQKPKLLSMQSLSQLDSGKPISLNQSTFTKSPLLNKEASSKITVNMREDENCFDDENLMLDEDMSP